MASRACIFAVLLGGSFISSQPKFLSSAHVVLTKAPFWSTWHELDTPTGDVPMFESWAAAETN
jgi:hypothetical protein